METLTKKNMFKAKVRWRHLAERGTKYFHGSQKRMGRNNICRSMLMTHSKGNPNLTSDVKSDMINECFTFFETLYKERNVHLNLVDTFCTHLPEISAEQRAICDRPIDVEEVGNVLFGTKGGTSPGPSGYSVEFFKVFWTELKQLVVDAINEIFLTGRMPTGLNSSVTTLIPKKGKDSRKVENLRPISLLNVSFKLLTKTLAKRVSEVMETVINRDQTGFIRGRYIGESIRTVLDLSETCSSEHIQGLLMLCDMYKAYDSVNWQYLKEVVRRFGFEENFRKWIDILYNNAPGQAPTARVQLNRCLSPAHVIERGLRQGCPLSCYLFLLCIEPLLSKIKSAPRVKGIQVYESTVKLTAYADDITVVMDGTEDSLRECTNIFYEFQKISGLSLNRQKSKLMWIGEQARAKEPICQDLGLSWTKGPIELLGVKIGPEPRADVVELNYREKIMMLDKKLNPWLQKGLTPYGRVYITKSEGLSQLNYLISVLPAPSPNTQKEIDKIIWKFVWGNKKDKIKRSVLRNEYKLGGLKAPDIETIAKSAKIAWVRRFVDQTEANWKHNLKPIFTISEDISIFDCNPDPEQIKNRIKNQFWREVVLAWHEAIKQDELSSEGVLEQILWMNKAIKLESNPSLSMNQLVRKGIKRVRDIYNTNDRVLLTSDEVSSKFDIHPMQSFAITQALPVAWKRQLQSREPGSEVGETSTKLSQIEGVHRCTHWAHRKLLTKVAEPENANLKWKQELCLPDTFAWAEIYARMYASTTDFVLRWFQYRILHRILPTNSRLFIYGIKDTERCDRCPERKETLQHMFVQCPGVVQFWRQFRNKMRINNLANHAVILGSSSILNCQALYTLVLLGKYYIWRCRGKGLSPSISGYVKHTLEYLAVEKYIARTNNDIHQFNLKWQTHIERLKNSEQPP